MQDHKSRRTARILLVVLAVVGLVPATACSSFFGPSCKQTAWSQGPVVVVADVQHVPVGGAKKAEMIPAGTIVYPDSQIVCEHTGTTLHVQHNGKFGWIAKSHVAPKPTGTPSSSPTPRPTRSTR